MRGILEVILEHRIGLPKGSFPVASWVYARESGVSTCCIYGRNGKESAEYGKTQKKRTRLGIPDRVFGVVYSKVQCSTVQYSEALNLGSGVHVSHHNGTDPVAVTSQHRTYTACVGGDKLTQISTTSATSSVVSRTQAHGAEY